MRNSMFKRAAALLIGAGAIAAVTIPTASAAPAPVLGTTPAPIVHTMPKAKAAKANKSAKSAAAPQAAQADETYAQLSPGQSLLSGGSLTVGDTTLVMQADGNLVLYLNANNGNHIQVLWSTGTWGNSGAYAIMQTDGNFVVYKQGGGSTTGGALWSTGTWGKPNSVFLLVDGALMLGDLTQPEPFWHNDSGFVLAKVNGEYVDQPADNLQGKQALGGNNWLESTKTILIQQADGNLVLYRKSDGGAIWASNTYNHPGALAVMTENGIFGVASPNATYWLATTTANYGAYVKVQEDGNVVLYKQGGGPTTGGAVWASNTWGRS
ncbi:hypothetical protein HUT16_10080 [Kitasatospora sp. NA04385]|uniref:hypothetical protein n=1 Tax=Kitasatospora sp. NA04385 TaxID=2742135 RepID=UPI0015914D96|nr:hypothetical protein [Kitasatospora sp. NA04385]QKW19372.1 hypothetical protein HUT16_10080 [Kitasatospora sp. NA04385]